MPLANEHTPFFYLFSGTCVDSRPLCLSLQRAMTPFTSFPCFFFVVVVVVVFFFFMGRWNFKNTDPFVFWLSWHAAPKYWAVCSSIASYLFILCNGSQLLACTFNVTWRPEFPNNNIFARDWAVSRHSVAETMFCYSCCAARDSHRVTQRKQWF